MNEIYDTFVNLVVYCRVGIPTYYIILLSYFSTNQLIYINYFK